MEVTQTMEVPDTVSRTTARSLSVSKYDRADTEAEIPTEVTGLVPRAAHQVMTLEDMTTTGKLRASPSSSQVSSLNGTQTKE